MEKVKISRELADSIMNARKHCTDEEILYALTQSSLSYPVGDKSGRAILEVVKSRGNTSLLQLASALINGYEIEDTPAEMVADYYAKACVKRFNNNIALGRVQAIEFVAKAYGLKIEGVNV